MQVEIRIREADAVSVLRGYIERRLDFALGRFRPLVRKVTVRVWDENGPRGGLDKHCQIRARLTPCAGPVVVEVVDADVHAAVDRAAERVGRQLPRRLERIRSLRLRREPVRGDAPHGDGGEEASRTRPRSAK